MRTLFLLCCLSLSTLTATAQPTLDGHVTDEDGQPLAGANVVVQGTFLGTSTDMEGRYQLHNLPGTRVVVRFSFIGFKPQSHAVDLTQQQTLDVQLETDIIQRADVVVTATRATATTPVAFSTVTEEDLDANNLGQDIPLLLNRTPSVVVSSDAGAGIGYADMRIRGTDMTRINVTINGIPLNDPESQGVFWVDLPDFASSLKDIQIQRGVGTSTNGAGAFGATVNLQTAANQPEAYGVTDFAFGSYNTQKYTVNVGSGLLGGRWAFDGRFSKILSDGYVDRAAADLRSYYIAGGYYGSRTTLQLLHFNGTEETYQSWWGTPEAALTGDQDAKREYALTEGLSEAQTQNLLASDRRYNHYLYENEVDHYQQAHYQLHLTHQLNPRATLHAALHHTAGKGYFEQFRPDDDFADYGLPELVIGGETLSSSDIIRRRWLDNDLYGGLLNVNVTHGQTRLTFGGAYNDYVGDHFGEIIWAAYANGSAIRDRYYDNVGKKTDGNLYLKVSHDLRQGLTLFGDLQYRRVHYETQGLDADRRFIDIQADYDFFNPKAGVNVQLDPQNRLFASVAIANREPSRTDFLDAAQVQPTAERLVDYELGFERSAARFFLGANLYLMEYTDQLIATGALNDVGALVKVNVPESYRRGIELQVGYQLAESLVWGANYTWSVNKIKDFTEVVYDYTNGFDVIERTYEDTDIALSPSHVAGSELTYTPTEGLSVGLQSKYVGEQFLDNTSNNNRKIDAFFVNNLLVNYTVPQRWMDEVTLQLQLNNLFDEAYASKGYTYTYIYGEQYTRNHYYPQAGRHVLFGIKARF